MFNNKPWVWSTTLRQGCTCEKIDCSIHWSTQRVMVRSRSLRDAQTKQFSGYLTQAHHYTKCRKCGKENLEIFEGCPKTLEEIW